MVQRKVPDKLGIQADHISRHDHQNRLSTISLKKLSSSQHHQDGKTRGPEVKKKMMKKSRSFKLSDIGQQSLKASSSPSSGLRRDSISQPGKPPPTLDVQSTCPKALLTPKKQVSGHARSVESSPNYMKPTSCFEARKESQSQARFSSSAKLVGASSGGKKPAKSSGSKLGVRTSAKTSSFKPCRPGSAKKSSRVALCASPDHVKVRRATCSSTLKDSKFPSYLALNHGGTESEGTSVMKVCPYTYCSLNGHHHKHASLPPLKRFLSAKRRALKTLKSSNLAVPSDKGVRDVDEEEAVERVGINFFIEIYAETEKKTGFVSSQVEEIYIEEELVVECLSDGSPQSEIDAEEALERCLEEIELVEAGHEENVGEDEAAERDSVCPFSDEEETEGSFSSESASEMEWEEGEFSEAAIEDGADNSSQMDDESESIFGCSSEVEDGLSNCDVDMKQEFEEESACFAIDFSEQESEQVDESLFGEQLSYNEDQCKDLNSGEGNLREGEELIVSEKTEESSDTDNQVDETFDLSSESRHVLEEISTSDLSEIKEEANGEVDISVEESVDQKIVDALAQDKKTEISICDGSDDHSKAKPNASEMEEDSKGENEITEEENNRDSKRKQPFSPADQDIADEELRNKWSIGKRRIKDSDEESVRKFNPREPNYLPLAADPAGEKVDLKHQEMDGRKNSEDWMIDHALQQAVTKLGPARKRRVALLVEAFETVSPITKFEPRQPGRLHHHLHHPTSPVFSHSIRPIQACN